MNELEKVLEAIRGELKLEPEAVEALSIQAWNQHYSLQLEGKRHHLVIYTLPDPSAINGLLFEHKLLRHLQESHFDYIPRMLVVNRDSLFPFDGGWFAITEWIDTCRKEDDPPVSLAQIDSMASGLADLHRYLATADMSLDYHTDHVFVYPMPHFMSAREELIERLKVRLETDAFDDEARELWKNVKYYVRRFLEGFPLDVYWRVRNSDPTRIVHGDFRPMNAGFVGDKLTHILDFNCCYNEIRLWDVAYTALGLGGKETVGMLDDFDRPARFLSAYHRAGRLSPLERTLLPDMMRFVVAKLMVGAWAGWWISDRVAMFHDLLDGGAEEIVRRANLV